ncbi:MAG: hypothetical protein IPM90_01765 [Austwickia sp.]|nr:hypothetical protein [Austwickia sp.]
MSATLTESVIAPEPGAVPPIDPAPSPSAGAARWQALGAPAVGRRVPGTAPVFAAGLIIGTVAGVISLSGGHQFDFGDTMAHLSIARRVLDSDSPGTSQLGAVWPPVPHLALLPFVQSLWLWRTGIGACVLGVLCLAAAGAALYRALARLNVSRLGRLTALAVLWGNPAYLYVSTTASTEPVLIALILAALAGLLGWAGSGRELSGGELAVFAGLPAAAAVLTRFEGTALALSGAGYVWVIARQRGLPRSRASILTACFAAPSAAAILGWLAFNVALFGDPFDFLRGPYSPAVANEPYRALGMLSAEGNLGLSLDVYRAGVVGVLGSVTVLAALLAGAYLAWRWPADRRGLALAVAGTPAASVVLSLVAGHQFMLNEASLPPGLANTRLALTALPWAALLIGAAAGLLGGGRVRTWASAATVIGVIALLVVPLFGQRMVGVPGAGAGSAVLAEATAAAAADADRAAASRWLGENYDGGGLLIDETSIPSAPQIGIPLRDHVNRVAGARFAAALTDPAGHARWILTRDPDSRWTDPTRDQLAAALHQQPALLTPYRLAFTAGDYRVYRLQEVTS